MLKSQDVIENQSSGEIAPRRLLSVDALRGFDMFWIMGGDYILRSLPKIHDSILTRALAAQMEHCEWTGFHFYDLIFPLFVFIVGVSIVFSVPRMIERGGRPAAIKRIVIRSVTLFLLGIFYMGGVANGFKNVYLAGVLHRIAVAYFANVVNFHRLAGRFVGGYIKQFLGNYAALIQALVGTALGFWLVHFLYRKKIFLRL